MKSLSLEVRAEGPLSDRVVLKSDVSIGRESTRKHAFEDQGMDRVSEIEE